MIYRLIHADVMDGLRTLQAESVQTCVTSPPYWGLRDYGIEPSVWDGDEQHDHAFDQPLRRSGGARAQGATSQRQGRKSVEAQELVRDAGNFCECGAWRGCLGLEPTPELFVQHIVLVFREVWRVLRDDGTLWVNLGDSYNGSAKGGNPTGSPFTKQGTNAGSDSVRARKTDAPGLKPKDLIGIPWSVAFALRADGWYLRRDIIWNKPNPMPESVRDRPTTAHEYLFLLSKSERYFYDADAIREPAAYPDGPNSPDAIASPYGQGFTRRALGDKGSVAGDEVRASAGARMGRGAGWRGTAKGNAKTFRGGGAYTGSQSFINNNVVERDSHGNVQNESGLRNKRSVWTVATAPFPEAHFATFPPDLIEPCILAGSRVGDRVLDPFNGSGTTGVVALSHQRDYDGIDRNADYIEMSRRRLSAVAPMFAREETYNSTNV